MSVWFPYLKDSDDLNRPCLICLHHAGGNASVFNRLLRIDADVLAVPVELPGHGRRMNEKAYKDMKQAAADLAAETAKIFKGREIFIFGHSMGSVIAYELCKALESTHGIFPKMLILSGRNGPSDTDIHGFRYYMGEQALLEEMKRYGFMSPKLLENKEFMKSFIPVTMSDYYMIEQYEYAESEKLHTPIMLCYGEKDPDIDPEKADSWASITNGSFKKKIYPGNHFYMFEDGSTFFDELVQLVKERSRTALRRSS